MSIWEVLLIGVALSMDAVAVGMTNGIQEPRMRIVKMLLIAGIYGLFQFLMPVVGYYSSSVFSSFVEKIAPWLSFFLLGIIGGKMILDGALELASRRKKAKQGESTEAMPRKPLSVVTLLAQGVATSIDALAVGITFLAVKTTDGLPMHAALCSLIIGAITFSLSLGGVAIGKKAGNKFSDQAGILGGCILVAIGIKILVEGLI